MGEVTVCQSTKIPYICFERASCNWALPWAPRRAPTDLSPPTPRDGLQNVAAV